MSEQETKVEQTETKAEQMETQTELPLPSAEVIAEIGEKFTDEHERILWKPVVAAHPEWPEAMRVACANPDSRFRRHVGEAVREWRRERGAAASVMEPIVDEILEKWRDPDG